MAWTYSLFPFVVQGYFSGTSQYQFIAETYIIIVLCILSRVGHQWCHVIIGGKVLVIIACIRYITKRCKWI